MRAAEHLRMAHFEDHYWWFLGRKRILAALLDRHLAPAPPRGRRILDLGCGSGGVLSLLDAYGRTVGLEPFGEPLRIARSRGHRRLVRADALAVPLADGAFDLITALDVLEHLPDDGAAAAEINRLLAPGGQLLLAVPAYRFLWSEHDIALDHYRRYVAPDVRALVEGAGLRVERLSYAITFLLPVVMALRLGQRLLRRRGAEPRPATSGLMELPPLLNRACQATLDIEAALLRAIDLPAGVSVLCVARKMGP